MSNEHEHSRVDGITRVQSIIGHYSSGDNEAQTIAVDSNGIAGLIFENGKLYFGGEYTPSIKVYNPATEQIFAVPSTPGRSWPLGYSSLGARDRRLKRSKLLSQQKLFDLSFVAIGLL